ncbi:MAG: hypothetical protein KY453_00520 [Gemmatimonadetes bacterium]|nr:hypothetical protein [Gemmatimonadota bacterium]
MGRTRRSRVAVAAVLTGAALAGTTVGAGAALAAQALLQGTWSAEMGGRRAGEVALRLDDGRHVSSLPDRDAADLIRRIASGEGPWSLAREAGVLTFEGTASERRARGTFTFRPDGAFREDMDALGLGRPSDREMLAAAVHGLTRERVRSLSGAGLLGDEFDDLLAAAIFDVDGAFLQSMEALGLRPDLDQLVAFRIHEVTPAFVREMRELGVGDDADDLLAMRIHGVSRAFVDAIRATGLGEPDADQVLALRIHGVDGAWLESMAEAGAEPADLDEAVAFRIHGVTPDLVRRLRERGYDGLDGDDLLKIRIHGLDRLILRPPPR